MVGARESDDDEKPVVTINCDDATIIAIRLALAGYYASPEAVLASPADLVLACWDHFVFESEYQQTYKELNKK